METIPAACRRKLTAWHRFQLLMFFQLVAVLDVRDHLGPRGVPPQACLEHTIPARQHGFPRKISHQLEQKDSPKLVTAAAEQSDSGKRVGPAAPTPPTTLSRERLIWAANRGSETRKASSSRSVARVAYIYYQQTNSNRVHIPHVRGIVVAAQTRPFLLYPHSSSKLFRVRVADRQTCQTRRVFKTRRHS